MITSENSVNEQSKRNLFKVSQALIWGSIVTIALAIRLGVALPEVHLVGDAKLRYESLAQNIKSGHGFSRASESPYTPDDFDQPLYPGFVAAIYWLTSDSRKAVVIVQLLLELLILLLTVKIAASLNLSSAVIQVTLASGLLCPFLPIYSATLLTEVVATLALTATCFLLLQAIRQEEKKWWIMAGVSSGLCLLTRPDLSVAIAFLVIATLALIWRQGFLYIAKRFAIFIIVVLLVVLPWMIRNYQVFHQVRLFGNVTAQVDQEYARWLDTWMDDPKFQERYWWNALDRNLPAVFPENKLSTEERPKAEEALRIAKEQGSFEGYPSEQFALLTAQAKKTRPFSVYVLTPLRRVALSWLRMTGYIANGFLKKVTYLYWLGLLGSAAVGLFLLVRQKQPLFLLLVVWLLGRTVLPLISAVAIEPRYMLEALPVCFILSGVAWANLGMLKSLKQVRRSGAYAG